VRQFSTPGGVPSHVSVQIPGSIHEGGELGYALAHAAGAAFDHPDLTVACVVPPDPGGDLWRTVGESPPLSVEAPWIFWTRPMCPAPVGPAPPRSTDIRPSAGVRNFVVSGIWIVVIIAIVVLLLLILAVKVVKQYEQGVLFRLGRVIGTREAGLTVIIPFVDVLNRVSLRIVTMPIQSQGIITRDNVSVDVSAVAYFRVVDAVKSVVAIENVSAAINQIAQTTLRKVVGQHTLDETLSETDRINIDIKTILDVATEDWGVEVTLVELKDIQLPDSMKRAMARQAEAEREKRAKIIAAEGEALAADALGTAADIMMAHPLALQLRNLQSLVEIGVDKNTTVVFPAPLMSTIGELGSFLARENASAKDDLPAPVVPLTTAVLPVQPTATNGKPLPAGN